MTMVYAGGICGANTSEPVKNCVNFSKVSARATDDNNSEYSVYASAGGICGNASTVVVDLCTNQGEVCAYNTNANSYEYNNASNSFAGGICGLLSGATIVSRSVNKGSIRSSCNSDRSHAGGIGGSVIDDIGGAKILASINEGEILEGGAIYSAGILGSYVSAVYPQSGNTCYISACASIGNDSHFGVIGYVKQGVKAVLSDCYYSAIEASGGLTTPTSGGGRFSAATWPDGDTWGWGEPEPGGWDHEKVGLWASPWKSLGSWNDGDPIYPRQ